MNAIPLPADAKSLLTRHTRCDRYDYLIAAACGVVGGMVDIFLVNIPKNSTLTAFSDKLADSLVLDFAKLSGWKPKPLQKKNVSSAIGFLEKNFKVNYDQRHSSEVQNLIKMSTKNHHMLSLGHSPSPVGLFFSVLNQLTATSSFLSQGEWLRIPTKEFDLPGNSLIQKVFFGVVNWFGHLMSDISGSSGSHGNGGRGTGIVMPFYELLSLCNFGKFQTGDARQDLATIAVRAFQEGYDLRHGMSLSLPALLCDLLTRFFWAFRQHFQYGATFKDCIPQEKHASLRTMLICSNMTFCMMDAADSALRSGGNFLTFFLRMNIAGWILLIRRVFKEFSFRLGIAEKDFAAYRELNRALDNELKELETGKNTFRQSTEPYIAAIGKLTAATSPEEFDRIFLELVEQCNLQLPWEGDFNEHMSNKNGTLHFR